MTFARSVCLPLLAATLANASAAQSDWRQFRGEYGDGVAAPQAVSRHWSEGGPPELWRREFGSGFSTVASVGDRLYTMGASAEHEEVFCLDAHTGETIWRVPLGERFDDKFGDGPRATPTVDGDLVFAVSSRMHLAALSTEDGDVLWQKNLLEEFGGRQPRYGFSPSVLVIDDRVIIGVGGGKGKAIAAFERETGEVLWTALDRSPGASTPLFVEIAGVPQLIFNRPRMMTALSLEGEVLWTYEVAVDVIVMAQFVAPDLVLTSSAHIGQGGVMLRVTKTDDGFSAEKAWVNRRFRIHFNNAVLVNGYLFGFDNSTLRCLNAETGKTEWSRRGFGKGSLIACKEVLYLLGDQGTLALAAAEPDAYRELGRVQAMQGRCWTSPTLAEGRLFVRNLEEIVAYDVSATVGEPIAVVAPEAAAATPASPLNSNATELNLVDVLKRYEEARGGLARWREVDTLELEGSFTAFSETGPFKMQRRRKHLYRFEYDLSGKHDARARDSEDLWWRYNRFGVTESSRVELKEYHTEMKRQSMFEPALLGAEAKGIQVKWLGAGMVDAQPTIDLELTFPGSSVEVWHLHSETFLEVVVESTIIDMNQIREPMQKRTFYSDYRKVDGLVLPFELAMEFGARLEEITVDRVTVNPELGPAVFEMPRKEKD